MKSSIKTITRASVLILAILLNHSAFADCIDTSDCPVGTICVGADCQNIDSSTASTADSTQSKTNTKKK